LWVLAVPRSFDEVEAELPERMRQREHFQDHTYTRAYPPGVDGHGTNRERGRGIGSRAIHLGKHLSSMRCDGA
jgi:hypothetical protein